MIPAWSHHACTTGVQSQGNMIPYTSGCICMPAHGHFGLEPAAASRDLSKSGEAMWRCDTHARTDRCMCTES
eukprot:7931727-Alexandrium_andersonii.AAC.1